MKKVLLVFLLTSLLCSFNLMAQNVGIGTVTPGAKLHVFNGSAGSVSALDGPLVVESSGSSFINILAPDAAATGVWFGKPASNRSGGIIYNDASYNPNGLDFRTNGGNIKMALTGAGNLGVGTLSPGAKLHVFDGSAGPFGVIDGPLVVESSGSSFINILAPGAAATGVWFGKSASNRSGGIIYNDASYNPNGLDFRTNGNVVRMVLTNAGNVGIGTNSPAYKFTVTDAPASRTPVAFIENTGGTFTSDGLYIKAGSNITGAAFFISFLRPDGTTIGSIQQAFANSITYNTASDKRLKNIIGASQKGLPDLMKINIYDYTFKSDPNKKVQTGFMAQELYEVFPQSVSKPRENNESAEKNPWMVDYGSITPLIIKSVQEQQQMIDELKKSNNDFKKQNQDLEKKFEAQQKQIDELKALLISQNKQNGLDTRQTASN